MYTVQIPADLKFESLDAARAFAQAADQLLRMADVRVGGLLIKTESGSLLPLIKPEVDRSKFIVGGQAARDALDRIVQGIAASAYRQLPNDLFDPAYEIAAAKGQVDLILLRDLVQQELYPDVAEAVEFLDSIVGRAAAEQASREFRRMATPKKPKGGK